MGQRVLLDHEKRWMLAVVERSAMLAGSVVYFVKTELTHEQQQNVKESRLRKCRKTHKGDVGEGVYHWDGMTDSEDEEWDPMGERRRKDEGEVRPWPCVRSGCRGACSL